MNIEALHFLRPWWLLALLPVPLIVWLMLRSTAGDAAWSRVCDARLLSHLLVDTSAKVRRWPIAALAAAWIATSLGLAGPTWERLPQPSFKQPARTVFVLDLSPSMLATDIQPSRLARARFKLDDALQMMPAAEIGLIVYADEPYAITPLTDDPAVVRSVLPLLEPSIVPGRRARPDRAIDLAHQLLEQAQAPDGTILVLTDSSGDDPASTRAAAERARRAGYRVSVLGVGTIDGAPVPGMRGGFRADADGRPLMAKLDGDGLAEVAAGGGGTYTEFTAGDDDLERTLAYAISTAIEAVAGVSTSSASIEKTEVEVDTWRDMGAWLVWVPLLLMPLAFRKGWVAALGVPIVLTLSATGSEAALVDWFARADQRGAHAFDDGRHGEAAELFEDRAWQAAAQYRDGDYDGAAASLSELAEHADPTSVYNLGNSLAKAGKLEQAIAAYDHALNANPDDGDATFNRDLVEKLLEQQKQDQQQGDDGQDEQQNESRQQSSDGQDGQEDEPQQQNADGQGEQQDESQQQSSDGQDDRQDESQQQSGDGQDGHQDEQTQTDQNTEQNGERDEQQVNGRGRQERQERSAQAGSGEYSPPPSHDATDQPGTESVDAPTGIEGHLRELSEQEQALEQALARVPDDPAGLLRNKILSQYVKNRYGDRSGGPRW